ncbi:MAG: SDR family oxidoreductase [Chloroflexota bacterium]|nr:SDR family oxidoreductase [Chloroflexota bacterium]
MQKVVLVTGATKGIGLAIATQLQHKGWRVFGTGRALVPSADYPFTPVALDVTSDESVAVCVQTVLNAAGRIDAVVNNAGYDLYGAAEETHLAELKAQVETNFYGAVRVTQAVLPIMRAQGSGRIINISSIGGLIALPFNSAYAASKFALEAYTEALRFEVLPHNIYASLIEPDAVATDTLDTSIREVANRGSTYQVTRGHMVNQMRKRGQDSSITPLQVAEAVVHALRVRRPRLRYPVGGGALYLPLLRTLLPQSWYETFMMRQFVTARARS